MIAANSIRQLLNHNIITQEILLLFKTYVLLVQSGLVANTKFLPQKGEGVF